MLRRFRESGPIILVPLAWTFAIAAHRDLLALQTVRIAHLVMTTLLVAFVVTGWQEMTENVLRVWRTVILVGAIITAAGTAALFVDPRPSAVLAGTVTGWLVIPAVALVLTGRRVDRLPWAYIGGGALSLLGAVVYVLSLSVAPALQTPALAVAGVGQTVGIVAAVVAY